MTPQTMAWQSKRRHKQARAAVPRFVPCCCPCTWKTTERDSTVAQALANSDKDSRANIRANPLLMLQVELLLAVSTRSARCCGSTSRRCGLCRVLLPQGTSFSEAVEVGRA